MYTADDTNITASDKSLTKVTNSTNKDLANIKQWLLANELSLNVAKTEHSCKFIGSDVNLNKITDVSLIHIDGLAMKKVSSAKCLCVKIVERLTWDENTDYVCKKVSHPIAGPMQTSKIKYFTKYCSNNI